MNQSCLKLNHRGGVGGRALSVTIQLEFIHHEKVSERIQITTLDLMNWENPLKLSSLYFM